MVKPINKLVRDNIPEICKANGKNPKIKILDDAEYTLELQKKLEEEEKKIKSPYTQTYKRKIGVLPFILAGLCIIVLFLIIYLIVSNINKAPTQVDELMPREECVYEFTY